MLYRQVKGELINTWRPMPPKMNKLWQPTTTSVAHLGIDKTKQVCIKPTHTTSQAFLERTVYTVECPLDKLLAKSMNHA